MTLLNPLLLAGALLALVPIIIHLLNRIRYRREPFGAMMFVHKSMKVRAHSIRLQQLILLLMRAAFFALLAMALARPIIESDFGEDSDQGTTHVIIFDGSFSMRQGRKDADAFSLAKASALRLVDNMRPQDNMVIIWGGSKPHPLFPKPSFDRTFLRNKIVSLQPGFESMNVPRALEQAFWVLEGSTLPRHRVYILTDGQKTGWNIKNELSWKRVADHRKVQKIAPAVYVLSQSPEETVENIAPSKITTVSPVIDTFRPTKFAVEVANNGGRDQQVLIKFHVDGEFRAEKEMVLRPGLNTVYFDHRFQASGSHYVLVDVSEDDLLVDNQLYLAVNVMKQVPVMIIEGERNDNPLRSDGKLLKLCLEASGEPNRDALFAVTLKHQTDMDLMDSRDLAAVKTVILCDVSSISDYFIFELEKFVRQGGGMMIGLGDKILEGEYNRMIRNGIMPATLISQFSESGDKPVHPFFPVGGSRAMLEIYEGGKGEELTNVDVRRYWKVVPGKDSFVLARFGEDPFLVYRNLAEGRVLLWTSTLNGKWGNFPYVRDYLPLIHNLVLSLSSTVTPPINLGSGDQLVYRWEKPITGVPDSTRDKPSGRVACELLTPDGMLHKVNVGEEDGEMTVTWKNTLRPGLYVVKPQGASVRHFTVRPDHRESDLVKFTSTDTAKLQDAVPITFVRNEVELARLMQTEGGVSEWWRPFVILALILMCVELYYGWRFSE